MSTAEDSSWREIDDDEVAKFEKIIEDGDYGTTAQSLSCQVLCTFEGEHLPAADGRARLANGKRMTQALKNKKNEYQNLKDNGKDIPSWATGMILQIFEHGCFGQQR